MRRSASPFRPPLIAFVTAFRSSASASLLALFSFHSSQASNAPVQRSHSKIDFHWGAPVVKVPVAHRAFTWIGRMQTAPDRGLEDSSNRHRFGPLYRSCCNPARIIRPRCATVWGTSQPGAGPVRQRGRAFTRFATSRARCAASHDALFLSSPPSLRAGFHGRGRFDRIMTG